MANQVTSDRWDLQRYYRYYYYYYYYYCYYPHDGDCFDEEDELYQCERGCQYCYYDDEDDLRQHLP